MISLVDMKRVVVIVGGIGNVFFGVDRCFYCVREGMFGVCWRVEFYDVEMWYFVIV